MVASPHSDRTSQQKCWRIRLFAELRQYFTWSLSKFMLALICNFTPPFGDKPSLPPSRLMQQDSYTTPLCRLKVLSRRLIRSVSGARMERRLYKSPLHLEHPLQANTYESRLIEHISDLSRNNRFKCKTGWEIASYSQPVSIYASARFCRAKHESLHRGKLVLMAVLQKPSTYATKQTRRCFGMYWKGYPNDYYENAFHL